MKAPHLQVFLHRHLEEDLTALRHQSQALGDDLMGRGAPRRWPRNSMEPVWEVSRPAMVFRMVDFPAPLAPMRGDYLPSFT